MATTPILQQLTQPVRQVHSQAVAVVADQILMNSVQQAGQAEQVRSYLFIPTQ